MSAWLGCVSASPGPAPPAPPARLAAGAAALGQLRSHGYDRYLLARPAGGRMETLQPSGEPHAWERDVRSWIGTQPRALLAHATWSRPAPREPLACSGSIALLFDGLLASGGSKRAPSRVAEQLARELDSTGDLTAATRRMLNRLEGTYAWVALDLRQPGELVVACRGRSVWIATAATPDGGHVHTVASDLAALPGAFADLEPLCCALGDHEIAHLAPAACSLFDAGHQPLDRARTSLPGDPAASQGHFAHRLAFEIHEQPRALAEILAAALDDAADSAPLGVPLDPRRARELRSIWLLGCGSARHAAELGRRLIERQAGLIAHVDAASEIQDRLPLMGPGDWVWGLSQSGETTETLRAVGAARARGCPTLGISNGYASPLARGADAGIHTRAGPERSIPSTKGYTTQVAVLALLALALGHARGRLDDEQRRAGSEDLRRLPGLAHDALAHFERAEHVAQSVLHSRSFVCLGRGLGHPLALEAALKLAEITGRPAEGFAGAELRHGPAARIDARTTAIALVTSSHTRAAVLDDLARLRSYGATTIAIASGDDPDLVTRADHVLPIPEAPAPLGPIPALVALQSLAYHLGVRAGRDVDRPRHLEKSVRLE